MASAVVVVERDDAGCVFKIPIGPWATQHTDVNGTPKVRNAEQLDTVVCEKDNIQGHGTLNAIIIDPP